MKKEHSTLLFKNLNMCVACYFLSIIFCIHEKRFFFLVCAIKIYAELISLLTIDFLLSRFMRGLVCIFTCKNAFGVSVNIFEDE